MKKLRMTCDSVLLLTQRRVARLEARVSELEARGAGNRPPGVREPRRMTPAHSTQTDELTKYLWIFAVLFVAAILVLVGLIYWGSRV